MPSWFTPRRFLVYSAYFAGVFSLTIGLFISKHVWDLHTTVRLIEKSWDLRGHDYRNASWIDKASHALLAGHEDVSEYNDLFWAKFAELNMPEDGQGSFDRSNLSPCESGYQTEWAVANGAYDKWGFVLYRTDYDEDAETWAATLRHINHTIRTHLEIEATNDGRECDPELVRDRAVLEIIEDRENLDGATSETIRALWRKRVDDGLVEESFKIGGWQFGWFRLNLNKGDDEGKTDDDGERKTVNGIALNLCLMYDWHARVTFQLATRGVPATGPRDPWEPFLVAIDGLWSPDRYMYLTSWAHGYTGSYGVALSLLFNDFHQATYDREMERHAPYMFMGGPIVDASASWWQRVFQSLLSTTHAVARPGRFPFQHRWQEVRYAYVREDSHWKKPEDANSALADEGTASPRSSDDVVRELLGEPAAEFYLPCLDSDEDQSACFKLGNLYVRKVEQTKEIPADELINGRGHEQVQLAE